MGYNGVIGVVGNCVAGKTTLVSGLTTRGYRAVNIAQEHSTAQRLWRRKDPDYLVCLSCTLQTAKKRREIYWGQERLDDQRARLAHARQHCDLYLPTDEMEIEAVLETVITAVNEKDKMNEKDKLTTSG
ncbi:MAG: hypothetical protein SCK29_13365 [Bacillota bacterium]|nr:hypothetical protein [Bacillota bacterium]MDW7685090.1 hypothetical protein [Bacillota bacterium]